MAVRIAIALLLAALGAHGQNPVEPVFPGNAITYEDLPLQTSRWQSTLSSTISDSDTGIPVASVSGLRLPTIVTIGVERIKVCSNTGNTLNVCSGGRGLLGAAAAHNSGAPVRATAEDYYMLRVAAELKATQEYVLDLTAAVPVELVNLPDPALHTGKFRVVNDCTDNSCQNGGGGVYGLFLSDGANWKLVGSGFAAGDSLATFNCRSSHPSEPAAGNTALYCLDSDGEFYRYPAGGSPAAVRGASQLNDLSDVTIVSRTTGDFLRYNGTAFVNTPLSSGDIPDNAANTSGNAATATALAANGANCSSGAAAGGVNASGAAEACVENIVAAPSTIATDAPVLGNNADRTVKAGTRSGDTTQFATVAGDKTTGKQLAFDASGNVIASAENIGGGGGAVTKLGSGVGSTNTGTSTSHVTMATVTIPGGTLAVGDIVRVINVVERSGSTSASIQCSIQFGGVRSNALSSNTGAYRCEYDILVTGATAQTIVRQSHGAGTNTTAAVTTASAAIASNIDVVIEALNNSADGADTATTVLYSVEVVK
jgi:hypothetical protein